FWEAALPESSLHRAAKRTAAGRAEARLVPTFIRSEGVALSEDERDLTRRKLQQKLAKFITSIQRASVRLEDVNGPRGGVDQLCRVKVVLTGLPSVIVENRNSSQNAAIDGALTGAERAVRRTLQRRRTKPLKRRG